MNEFYQFYCGINSFSIYIRNVSRSLCACERARVRKCAWDMSESEEYFIIDICEALQMQNADESEDT